MRSRSVLLLVVAGLVVAGMVAAPAAPAAPEDGGGVFRSATGPAERAIGRHALRERFVTIDTSRLSPQVRGSGSAVFNLFDDAVVEATMERTDVRGPDDFTWVGKVGGLGYVVITVINGVAAGRIVDVDGRAFTVSYVGDGVHVVTEPDPSSFPPKAEPPTPRGVLDSGPVARATGNTRVDLLVAYTESAADLRGGNNALEALITTAVTEANLGFEKSGIAVALRLVDVRRVGYSESGDSDRDLERLQKEQDGYMDNVHRWRDASGADVVSLITDGDDVCGVGYLMSQLTPSFESYAFNVVTADCLDFEASLAHEIGHNFGAAHEREIATSEPLYPYAYAFVDYVNDFRTIMAYGDFCTPQWTGCPMILRFSSSSERYSGLPIGDRDTDNARAINNTAATVAGFRNEVGGGGSEDTCAGLTATLTPADAVDGVIVGTSRDDVILGSDGRDIIEGKGGDDVICSLGDRDTVYGNGGNDIIYGGDGDDVIKGGAGRDLLYGENGDDRLLGNPGSDSGDGGGGTDTCKSIETATSCESGTTTTTTTTVPTSGQLDYTLPAALSVTLPTNFPLPDPRVFDIISGGNIGTAYLNTDPLHGSGDCTGYAIQSPDFELTYTAGTLTQPMLRFWWSSNDGTGDAVLIINAPNGKWYCNDDSYGTNHPTVDFSNPLTGIYDVYVASRTADGGRSGMLRVTELNGSHP
ncbi:MAG: M12 family metallo-peptidase [Actinomycetota bacterium]